MRLFFALWPPAQAARALGEWAQAVQKACGGRATREGAIHLTLAFLGDADPMKASAAGRKVKGRAFDFPLDAARYWPHNRIVWIGPQRTPDALADLVLQLHDALRSGGLVLEDRPFAAHVTLIRKAGNPLAIPALPAVSWPAAEFLLVRSKRSSTGSAYEAIERFPLAARG
ncbi:MAG TPA: RNA 2',3'-cyclic phosphodiesterase [Burkholderiales bacterium]